MNFIFIEGFRLDVLVGIYSRERVVPQTVEFDLHIGLPETATAHDNIADTVSYAEVIECIRTELTQRHFNLVETLGEFVADLVCVKFASPWAKVSVAKLGLMKDVRRIGVCIQRGRRGPVSDEEGA